MDSKPAVRGRETSVADVIRQMRAERRSLALMRLSFVALACLAVFFIAWAVPWIPIGMTTKDYRAATTVVVVLSVATSLSSAAFLLIWGPQFRHEPLPEFLRVLRGAQQFIRGRQQFHYRLAAECRRARRDRRLVFSLIVIELPVSPADAPDWSVQPKDDRQLAAMLVRTVVRARDIVADSPPREVWVLAPSVHQEARQRMIVRLAHALTNSDASLAPFKAARIGGGTFGQDGEKPDDILSAAHRRLAPMADFAEQPAAA